MTIPSGRSSQSRTMGETTPARALQSSLRRGSRRSDSERGMRWALMTRISDRVLRFRDLHGSGCFVIPNPWDVGSARTLVRLGFPALATTSSGFAWSQGRRDNQVSLDDALTHM